ncbi:uncharacterized protein [Prorops nasuta]|uniref:uncharacterized protein n=1 Tax=Prorops nasuta TaxID=863751 RepID=UPI0034CF79AC
MVEYIWWRRQCRNYPLRPPGPSERCLASAPYLEQPIPTPAVPSLVSHSPPPPIIPLRHARSILSSLMAPQSPSPVCVSPIPPPPSTFSPTPQTAGVQPLTSHCTPSAIALLRL